jgi:hypothetical protein
MDRDMELDEYYRCWDEYVVLCDEERVVEQAYEEEMAYIDAEICSADPYGYHGVRREDF